MALFNYDVAQVNQNVRLIGMKLQSILICYAVFICGCVEVGTMHRERATNSASTTIGNAVECKEGEVYAEEGERTTETEKDYISKVAEKLEGIGRLNYPEAMKMVPYKYEKRVLLEIRIRNNGELINVIVIDPSCDPMINDAAKMIVKLSEPFAPFTKEIKKTEFAFVKRFVFAPSGAGNQSNQANAADAKSRAAD